VYAYTDAGQLLSEDGPWSSDAVSYAYNNRLRSTMTLGLPSGSGLTANYGYDAGKRLANITSWAGTFAYKYASGAATEVQQINLPNGAYITNRFDSVARELSTRLLNSSASPLNTRTLTFITPPGSAPARHSLRGIM